jgi:dienelactone hydrolase
VEHLLHDTGLPRMLLPLRTDAELSRVFAPPKLERAIGVGGRGSGRDLSVGIVRITMNTSANASAVQVPLDGHSLPGDLTLPPGAAGLVLFAHGSGSSRRSPRNQFVARTLERSRLATLLIDLLTPEEEAVDEQTAHLRFDIDLLANRLVAIVDWLRRHPQTETCRIGLFGASTGGGAALVAAARRPDQIAAVVSRGGRPDLAGDALPKVTAPTLLIVGGHDAAVIDMNRDAMERMHGDVALEIVPGASHLFEEPGTLNQVAELAADFFSRHLAASGRSVQEPSR